ncbi:MAG TPA: hypothetical protein VHZ49_19320 [Methylomirabilota bacterium]|jgi:hypothetical protein|nr:hypothetical protein [Methylomirabilota bacterium]
MTIKSPLLAIALLLTLSACATNPPRLSRSAHEDIPVPKGLAYRGGDSTVIETPTVSASREVYRGRLEMESLAQATRSMLEANGWRHVGTSKTSQHGVSQVYEKEGTSLQVLIWEDLIFTYAEYTTARVLQTTPTTVVR